MFGVLLIFLHFYIGNAVYFSMTNIKVTVPNDRNRFPPGNHVLTTLYAHSATTVRFSLNGTKTLQMYPTTGDILFTNLPSNTTLDQISAGVSVVDTMGQQDYTSIIVEWIKLSPFDCDLIIEDLCYWQSINYRIFENQKPSLIGSLSSPFLLEMCPNYKINYKINESNDFWLIPPNSTHTSWSIATVRELDRDLIKGRDPLRIMCTVENKQGSVRNVHRDINVEILDVNDNPPKAQENEINVALSSNVVLKGQMLNNDIIFHDKDTPAVNKYETKILRDIYNILEVICNKYENDYQNKEPQTAIHCKLKFTKNMQIPNSTYSVRLEIKDATLLTTNNKVEIPIHLHFHNESGYPAMIKKQFNRPLLLYPTREVKIFRTAGPLARITQPPTSHIKDATNFSIQPDPVSKDIFNVTNVDGIVFVHDIDGLRTAPEYLRLNISWYRMKKQEYDEIQIRIVEEPTKTCHDMNGTIWNWPSCSEYSRPNDCESGEACAISTGGSHSVAKRNGPERCMWRGDRTPGTVNTHLYATCTPDITTCPDGICDALEELYYKVCPQDCSEKIHFPTSRNPKTGRGIDRASGVCYCDEFGGCHCDNLKRKTRKKISKTTVDPLLSSTVQVNNSGYNYTATGKILGIELTKCGTSCILGIVAGMFFLVLAATLIGICWRLDRVNKVVRGKFHDENQDLAAPLSNYIDRTNPDPLPINFDMTTSLADNTVLNIINKYAPDPKWEFPRNQLIIEQTLGEGEFGRVLRAKALNIAGQTGYTTVAVKTLKEDARESELNDLLSEYQLLKEVSHSNVIRLLGVCTSSGGPIYLIIEFAEYGSLRNYLRRSRHLKSESRFPASSIDESEIHYDEPNVSQVTPKQILSFAWQICKGMVYLSEIKLVHRDLAARNVLLAAEKICKISDFGLTRDIYEDDAYFKRSKGRVPVKWMAPESLSDHIYTNKSDIWSFGILLWELVTLGATPYPGIAVQNLFHLLRQGYRMERPDNCSPELYNIMRSCWDIDPEQRPTFQELSIKWEKMLADQVDYLDLTNNAIHNRSYFCANILDEDKSNISPLNYLSKSQSYVKCGSTSKLQDVKEADSNQNQINTQGYETPVRISKTPTNESPQYYTDMAAGKILNNP